LYASLTSSIFPITKDSSSLLGSNGLYEERLFGKKDPAPYRCLIEISSYIDRKLFDKVFKEYVDFMQPSNTTLAYSGTSPGTCF